jgi:hypothetical protein
MGLELPPAAPGAWNFPHPGLTLSSPHAGHGFAHRSLDGHVTRCPAATSFD